jgi:glutamyl/glutaminyl-tRNA synthetase
LSRRSSRISVFAGARPQQIEQAPRAGELIGVSRQWHLAAGDVQLSDAAGLESRRRRHTEIFSRDELIEKFSLEGVNKAGAIFDIEKLQWMNIQYLKAMPVEEFMELARPFLKDIPVGDDEYSKQALNLARERIHNISDIKDAATYFFSDDYALDETGAAKHLTEVSTPRLRQLRERFATLPEWNHDAVEGAIRSLAEELSIKPAELIHPSRMAVSGRTVGPSVFELLAVLGRERVLGRLQKY